MFFLINVFYFITLILLQGHQSKARGPVCLQCDQVSQPSDCRNIKRCGDQDLCSMRKYVTNNGHMWFDVGCSSSQRCSPITSILGKRNDDDGLLPISSSKLGRNGKHNIKTNYVRSAGDTIVCEKCCSGDICNAGSLCGTVGFLHEMVCFKCASTNEDGCSTIELCDQNEKCFIEKVINSSTSQNVWKTGCRHKDMCKQLQSNPETECLSSCCSSDLCNRKCTINNADAKCVDMSQTCTNETFQSFVCSTKELQAVCPRSCGLCHCSQNPCTHGTCTSTRQGYKCTCDAGYTGSICDRVIEHCSPNPCVHGICNNSPQGFSCRCSSGYKGSTCTVIKHCSPNPCVHGICNNNPQGYSCSCISGYKGSTCTVIDHCSPNPCVHGICNNNPQGYNCRCSSGYKGSTCTDMDLIDPSRVSSLNYTDCNSNQALLHFDSVRLNPYQPNIPGNITVSGHLVLGRNLSGDIELQVSIHKHAIFWIPIPCLSNFGSCTYDFCSMLRSKFNVNGQLSCPPQLAKQNLPCTCPIQAGTYTLNPDVWTIPPFSSFWNSFGFANGDFKVDAKLVNKDSGEIIGCYNIKITFARKCTGFGCIFG